MDMSIYPKQGYFVDYNGISKTCKIFRAIHIDKTHSETDMIGMVYTLINDDIFTQTLEQMEEERMAFYEFTTQNEMFGIYYNRCVDMYPDDTISRSITSNGGKKRSKFFYTYMEALVYLYKQMSYSETIKDNTIKKNGIDFKCFVKYMKRHKEIYPEEFV
jgi:hypothetical protein